MIRETAGQSDPGEVHILAEQHRLGVLETDLPMAGTDGGAEMAAKSLAT